MNLKVVLIVLTVVAILLAIGTEIRMSILESKTQATLNKLSNTTTTKINSLESQFNKFDNYFKPNGMVEKYIVANTFITKQMNDLDSILTQIQDGIGYFQIYITGGKSVWFGIRDGQNYTFQEELKPGLNNYKFYFFKKPNIATKYTLNISPYSAIKTSEPAKVYFLIHEPGQYRVKQYPQTEISNLMKDLNLYIPTVTGN